MRRVSYLSAVCFALSLVCAQAQTTKISDTSVFSEDSVELDFSGFQNGVGASEIYSRWGITITGTEGSSPQIKVISVPIGGIPENQLDRVVQNVGPAGLAKSLPLVINFKYPVSRVAFEVSNAPNPSLYASLIAYDPAGEKLGTVAQNGLNNETFFGVSTSNARGIGKVVLDFGNVEAAEQIDNLTFEYLSRSPFVTYLTQVADAKATQFGPGLQTILVISNLTNSTAQGDVRLMTYEGASMSVDTDQGENDTFPFQLQPFASQTITTTGQTEGVKRGYAVISSGVPVEGSAIFRVVDANGTALQEAGVGAAPAQYQAVTLAQKEAAAGLDTGVAIVNPSGSTADVTAYIYNEQGSLIAGNDTDLDLEAGAQTAQFLSELFPELGANFKGTLFITSTQPIAVVTLRTVGNVASSTLPVGSTGR